jgi:hypothetical protein
MARPTLNPDHRHPHPARTCQTLTLTGSSTSAVGKGVTYSWALTCNGGVSRTYTTAAAAITVGPGQRECPLLGAGGSGLGGARKRAPTGGLAACSEA